MKWIKKWSYLLIFTGVGICYLSCVDKWQVYAEPIAVARALYEEMEEALDPVFGTAVIAGNETAIGDGENTDEPGQTEGPGQPEESGQSGQQEGLGQPEESGQPQESGQSGQSEEPVSGVGNTEEGSVSENEPPVAPEEKTPVYSSVEDDYFADAVFIGDSRTVGLYEYGGLEEISTFYASTGLTVYKLFDAEIVQVPGQKKKISVEEALSQNQYKKIYLMIGINEMGTGTVDTFAAKYAEVMAHLLELQPDAILYIQGIMKVTTERSEQGDYINNEGIEARNEALAQLADNERIFYLDVNPEICDETGGMVASYTFDGVHLKAQYIEIWKEFLKAHAIQ